MKQWILRENLPESVSAELKDFSDLERKFLFYRGVAKAEEAAVFLNPDYEKGLYDPFKILNMEKAVARILDAMKNKEKIVVFGDYDADGVCSTAIFTEFLKKAEYENYHVHIPDRNLDGYSLNSAAIGEFKKLGAKLIITFDCGITDKAEVAMANSLGIDVIITDHHLVVPEVLPDAFTIINSKQEEDKYPYKFLCGAGVAFKLVRALITRGGEKELFTIAPGWEKWLLDIVAIATVADMAPLTGENRVLVRYGLTVLSKTKRLGLKSFYKKFRVDQKNITESDISFTIAPRINVASRIEHATISFDLLTADSPDDADRLADKLDSLNKERKRITSKVVDSILEKFEGVSEFDILACGDESWHPGVLGLAANKLMEKYNKPIFLWGSGNSAEFKGSCRSDGSVNLVELMSSLAKGVLLDFGGHHLAAGFSLKKEKAEEFKKELENAYGKAVKQDTNNGTLLIDSEWDIDKIDWDFYSKLEKFSPFGVENPNPVFGFYDLEIGEIKEFGNGGGHLNLSFRKKNGEYISAISFFKNGIPDDVADNLFVGQKINLAATIEKNTFFSKPELRLRVIDVKLK